MSRTARRDILLTGYSSYVSRRMLQTLVTHHKEATFRVLVRPDHVDAARRHINNLDVDAERVLLLSGDIIAMDLGLSGMEYLDLIAHVTDIFHIASRWHLGVDRKQVFEVNVLGTQNIIDAATEMKQLRRLNHFSTAFVAGDRTGVIMEDELDESQGFHNFYEKTKYQAEISIRAAMRTLPISIFRPSIIVGDSQSGEFEAFSGSYDLLNTLVLSTPSLPMFLPGKGDKPLNMVPIDFVCNAMHFISEREDSVGKTFHLCDPNPLSAKKVLALVARRVGKPTPIHGLPYHLAKFVLKFPYLDQLTRSQRQLMEDFNQLIIYNCINTLGALTPKYACPPFSRYVDNLITYIKTTEGKLDVDLPLTEEILG